jgi:adenine-specific DNA glycosylase
MIDDVITRFGTVVFEQKLPEFSHTFTHFKLRVSPVLIQLADSKKNDLFNLNDLHFTWYEMADIEKAPLPSPVKKLLGEIASRVSTESNFGAVGMGLSKKSYSK